MNNHHKILSGAQYKPWAAPEVTKASQSAANETGTRRTSARKAHTPTAASVPPQTAPQRATAGLMTAAQLAQIEQQAHGEGFARGRSEGLAAGKAEVEALTARFNALCTALGRPLLDLDEEVVDQMIALAIALARQLVRRELKTDPGEIVAVVRSAVGTLPVGARDVSLRLHPEDAELVRECLSIEEGARAWNIVEDPVLVRGDCRVSSDVSRVDASLETRLNAQIATMLGGERANDPLR
jgi:flagellar assembly protein FliH